MKLVIAMVQDDDALDTTLIIGVEADKVQKVIDVVEDICKTRKQIITTPTPITGNLDMYMSYPIEVEVGGATIFVIDVDQFIKI